MMSEFNIIMLVIFIGYGSLGNILENNLVI